MSPREELRAKLMLVWGRTIEEHKIPDFDVWVSTIATPSHVPPAGRKD